MTTKTRTKPTFLTHSTEYQLNHFPLLRYDGGHGPSLVMDSHDGAAVDSPTNDSQAGSAEMAVNGPGPVQNPNSVKTTFTTPPVKKTAETRPATPRDEVEISTAGKMLDSLNQSGDVRAERLANIKTAIDAGKYETPEKLEAALLKMLQEIDTPDE